MLCTLLITSYLAFLVNISSSSPAFIIDRDALSTEYRSHRRRLGPDNCFSPGGPCGPWPAGTSGTKRVKRASQRTASEKRGVKLKTETSANPDLPDVFRRDTPYSMFTRPPSTSRTTVTAAEDLSTLSFARAPPDARLSARQEALLQTKGMKSTNDMPNVKDDVNERISRFLMNASSETKSKMIPIDDQSAVAFTLLKLEECKRYKEDLVSSQGFVPCGEGYCLCRGKKADCSCNLFNLHNIPALPGDIRELNLTYALKLNIHRDDFFANVSQLTSLDLSYCGLSNLSRTAFSPMQNLTWLWLNGNRLTYSDFPVFIRETLETLNLDSCHLAGPLPEGIFEKYPMPRLKVFWFMGNHMGSVNMTEFQPLTSLTELYIDGNQLWRVLPDYLPQLEVLSLGQNSLLEMFGSCRNGTSLFPRLKDLRLYNNPMEWWDTVAPCLPNITNLLLQATDLHVFSTGLFSSQRLPKLQNLIVDKLRAPVSLIDSRAFESLTVADISLTGNDIDFSSGSVHEDSFAGCPNVLWLTLNKNDFSKVTAERFLNLFGHLKQLMVLDLSSSNFRNISASMFSQFTYLYQLNLCDNRIAFVPDDAFSTVIKSGKIYLHNNQISTVQEAAFSPATRQRLQHLDLSDNPFRCSCDLRWFSHWLATDLDLFRRSQGPYMCENLANTQVADFTMVDQACLLPHQTSLLIIVITSAIIISLTLLLTVFRYRWHLRLLLYEAFRGQGQREQRLLQQHFDYDVFVSYDSDDALWVRQYLMPELEGRRRLRLCLHERDFIPGKPIVQNINECVEASKKVVVLFSTGFAHSPWCQFELDLCLTHVMDNDDMLLVLMLHDIPGRDLTSSMRAVIKTTTYIRWPDVDEHDSIHAFWGRIDIALAEIIPTVL